MIPLSDPFKVLHKKYRQKNCGLLEKSAEFVDLINDCSSIHPIEYDLNERILDNEKYNKVKKYFKRINKWKFYTLNNAPSGLILVPGIFDEHYSKDVFDKLLYELPKEHLLLKSNIDLPLQNIDKIRESNLRWFTFGYHYDWTNKIYSKNDWHKTPDFIDDLVNFLKGILRLDMRAEAGIVNYYTCKSKLNPHSDCREENLEPPLLSVSFGEKAVFLIGQHRYSGKITPLILRDGDIMIMSNESRLAYHSISKIICNNVECKGKLIKRINLNIRQVY